MADTATEERGFASYRGLMTGGTPFPCKECADKGRSGVLMTYRGIEQSTALFNFGDYMARVPFDVWQCPQGHRYTDGY